MLEHFYMFASKGLNFTEIFIDVHANEADVLLKMTSNNTTVWKHDVNMAFSGHQLLV